MTKDTTFNPDITSVKESEAYRKQEEVKKKMEMEHLSKWQRFANFFKNGRTRFSIGVILLLTGIYLLIAFLSFIFGSGDIDQNREIYYSALENAHDAGEIHNLVGALGASVSELFIRQGFGLAAFILVLWCIVLSIRFFKKNRKTYFFSYTLICLFSLFAFSLIMAACTLQWHPTSFPVGGNLGKYINELLLGLMGLYGMVSVNFVVGLIWVMLCYKTFYSMYQSVKGKIPARRKFNGDDANEEENRNLATTAFLGDKESGESRNQRNSVTEEKPVKKEQNAARTQRNKKTANSALVSSIAKMNLIDKAGSAITYKDPTGEFIHYKFPPLELLNNTKMKTDSVDVEEQEANKKRITETLNNYGIQIKTIQVHVGPTVTLFEIIPEDGVRISKIRGLEDDIALSLAALGIRIIAPMPGRGTIGIEVPNCDPQIVPMRQVLGSRKYVETKAKLPMALGCTVSNEVFVADLTKMPHLLVAGATGKGKSVGLNAIIASLLYKKGPSELKLILIDPKRVEFSIYADIEKYYFARVPGESRCIVTDTEKVVKTLNCLVQEMEDRYKVLEKCKMRKIEDYNHLWRTELRDVIDADGHKVYKFMPYIVCVVDEFSDMIMTAGKEVETPIVRIAQKARAVGIHMIIATQRPSANVITGLIKGNFPGRIAFAVSQMTDSRIILDRSGAQHLIGRGDMLFSVDGEITRLQCPFIDTPEIIKICEFIKEQEDNDINVNHEEPYELPEYVAPSDDSDEGGYSKSGTLHDRDPLFEEVAKWVVQTDTASTSSVQRRYSIGYNRAGRIMDQLETAGIVGPATGGKPRKVLVTPMDVDQLLA